MQGKDFKKSVATTLLMLLSFASYSFAADEDDRVKLAAGALQRLLSANPIPRILLDQTQCLVILPSIRKGAFGVRDTYGRGVIVCRNSRQKTSWGPPAFYSFEGGALKLPGGHETDILLLVMSAQAQLSLFSDKTKLGKDVSIGEGPTSPAAPLQGAALLSYALNANPLQGVSLAGSTLRSDSNADKKLYGKKLTTKEIVADGKVSVPACARQLVAMLDKNLPAPHQ